MLAQRGRHADQDGVGLGQPGEVGRGLEPAAVAQGRDALRGDVADVALAGLEAVDLGLVDVEPEDREALPANSSTSGRPT